MYISILYENDLVKTDEGYYRGILGFPPCDLLEHIIYF